jgi:hypothetical protein
MVELTSIVLLVTGVSVQPSVSVLDGHDGVFYSDSVEDTVWLDCDSEMGVDEWSGMGNYD